MADEKKPEPMTEDQLHDRCKYCKRPLKGLLSRMVGAGPNCAEKRGIVRRQVDDPNQMIFPGCERKTEVAREDRGRD
ncbi:MAG: DUF6011 domain-containing protein [Pseudobdellovibrionaceae bacterium]